MEDRLEEIHEELLDWAEGSGMIINNIRPMRLSGRGFGIVATDHIPEDTEILTVPCSMLRSLGTVPSTIARRLPGDLTVHGLLAADLALNHRASVATYAKWDAVVPTWEDIQRSMPMLWPPVLQGFLPAAAAELLFDQRKKFEQDWDLVSAAFPFPTRGGIRASCTEDEYLYAWMLVNTRTFYFVTPRTKKLPQADHMVLQPVADLFNHTDQGGCAVAYNEATYSFRTTRPYEKGEEIHISYGNHSNDFLLVEYGFVLDENRWDEVCLDDAILPPLSRAQKMELEDVGFLGNYMLDKDTACHRTQVALRLMLTEDHPGLSMWDWQRFVDGLDDGEQSQRQADETLVEHLREYYSETRELVKELKELRFEAGSEDLNESRRQMLLKRWGQIRILVRGAIERLS